ncbi:ATP-dependent RNA helicase DHX8 [Tothia fuscella]|uniref:ATP-dependent RNA helicase DHX8 n=1 Tax=Tothia fuscella TaxID=1048955 RepID=A0A9P4TXE7_9PEZI|nr:ATP-dependent RNA helicase DHX8 [Tothia fuscella]
MRAQEQAFTPPLRQIRAHYDAETVTVYQAYSESIAHAAVTAQKLNASPLFKDTRTTWVKPSWCWMMYRSGYSFKDEGQARILAIRMKHEHFVELLRNGRLAHEKTKTKPEHQETKGGDGGDAVVTVQWDPERDFELNRMEYRSIQIGIPKGLSKRWCEEWIVGIQDVTERARELKKVVDEGGNVGVEQLTERGLVPVERVYDLPEELEELLGMLGP